MGPKQNSQLTLMCHPYMFALKEGQHIGQDMLDYSLLLLQRNCSEVINSPEAKKRGFFLSEGIFMSGKDQKALK